MNPQKAPARTPATTASGIATIGGHVGDHDADDDRPERPHEELALGADVEQAGLEPECDGEAAEDERGRRDERVHDRLRAAERALRRAVVGGDRQRPSRRSWSGMMSSDARMMTEPDDERQERSRRAGWRRATTRCRT